MTSRGVMKAFPVLLAGLAAGCGGDPEGVTVELNLGAFTSQIDTLRVVVTAEPGGFQMPPAEPKPPSGVALSNTTDPNGAPALVVTFSSPGFSFEDTLAFRLATGNRAELNVTAQALAFASGSLIAGGESAGQTLPPGGLARLPITLGERSSPIGTDTRTTDLAGDTADLTVNGGQMNARLGPIVVCNVDGDSHADLVIGAPAAQPNSSVGSTGAVYIVFGGESAATIDLSAAVSGENHFYGRASGDNLGAAVACADLDEDGADDIVAGAHRAGGGQGRVYVVFGGGDIRTRAINLASPTMGANVEWTSSVANAELGRTLFAGDVDDDGAAEVFIGSPGTQKVHLFTGIAPTATAIDAELPGHPTFSGVPAAAIAVGDFDHSGAPFDVALGDPTHMPAGASEVHGIIYVFRNVSPGTAADRSASTAERTIVGQPNSLLGAALGAADSGNGVDLLAGAPGAMEATGQVELFENNNDFFTAAGSSVLRGIDPGGRFGAALAIARSGLSGSGTTQIVVGAPDVQRGPRTGVGAAYLFHMTSARTFPLLELVYGKAANDHLGTYVAGGPVNSGDRIADLVASAPDAQGAAARSGVTYVRYR